MNSTFSPEAIKVLSGRASIIRTRHQRYADAMGGEIQLVDRLLAAQIAGVPDVATELIAAGRRLAALVETGGPSHV